MTAQPMAVDKSAKDKTNPLGEARAAKLIAWYNAGAGGKIRWGTPGDFDACVRIAGKHMTPDNAKGFCALRHRDATGARPGQAPAERAMRKSRLDLLHRLLAVRKARASKALAGGRSFDELRELVNRALKASYLTGPDSYCYVRDMDDEWAVFELGGTHPDAGTYRVDYAVDQLGEVTWGEPKAVEAHVSYDPKTRLDLLRRYQELRKATWDEAKHPRAPDGRFGDRPGVHVSDIVGGFNTKWLALDVPTMDAPTKRRFNAALERLGKFDHTQKRWVVQDDRAARLDQILEEFFGSEDDPKLPRVPEASLPSSVSLDATSDGRVRVRSPYSDKFRVGARALGGRWDPAQKAWLFEASKRTEVEALASRAFTDASGTSPPRTPPGQVRPRSQPSRATEKQVHYIMQLLDSGAWHDSDAGQFSGPPSESAIRRMTVRDASEMIGDLSGGRPARPRNRYVTAGQAARMRDMARGF